LQKEQQMQLEILLEKAPLTIPEALSAKTPVITSNTGSMKESVERHNGGLLFRLGDAGDLYDKIMMVINKPEMISEIYHNITNIKTRKQNAEEIEELYKKLP